ncbi:hypothetical protein JAAARDRAFT_524820 [Jaapia argillacea MUCL 33604]|uniref:Protein kinase domain-containing protein n=1 Tax=Jaapia argillacea MUCL 33604 TaxID=933084 RepID=A0A067QGY6_9AGAM|nr:hypothetical protein JAAARDRAFT_524820 [Jaapia argillacea MUCL 33604]
MSRAEARSPSRSSSPSNKLRDLGAQLRSIDDFPHAQGSFSDVYRGMLSRDNVDTQVAVKIFRVSEDEQKNAVVSEHYRREVQAYELLHLNPHIAEVLGVATIGDKPALVMKWYESGDISHYLHLQPHVSVRQLALDIVQGLKYLHSNDPPIFHGDLKPSNILVNNNGRAVLCDFGSAHILDGTESTVASLSGSCRSMAPELFPTLIDDDSPSPVPTTMSDIWSLGCAIAQLITSKKPYRTRPLNSQVILSIVNGILPYNEADFLNAQTISEADQCRDLWDIVGRCWEMDPVRRPAVDEFEILIQRSFVS